MGPTSYAGLSYNFDCVSLFVCLSVHPFRIFFRTGSSVFFIFGMMLGAIYTKKWQSSIFIKISFLPKFGQKAPQNRVFYIVLKNLLFDFPKSNAKWKFLLFLISIANSLSGKILVLELLPNMILSNQIDSLKCTTSRKNWGINLIFCLQVGSITLGGYDQVVIFQERGEE